MNPLWYGLVAMWTFCAWILACSGNLIVIWVFMNTKLLRSPANYYVVNLALSDFTLMFCMCPPLLYNRLLYLRCHWLPHRLLLHPVNDLHLDGPLQC